MSMTRTRDSTERERERESERREALIIRLALKCLESMLQQTGAKIEPG